MASEVFKVYQKEFKHPVDHLGVYVYWLNKICIFFWVCWFLAKNIQFCIPPLKTRHPYYHVFIWPLLSLPLMYQKRIWKVSDLNGGGLLLCYFLHRKLKAWQWQKRGHLSHDLWTFYVRSAIFRQQIKRLYNCKKTSATLCIFSKSLKSKSLTSYNAITA